VLRSFGDKKVVSVFVCVSCAASPFSASTAQVHNETENQSTGSSFTHFGTEARQSQAVDLTFSATSISGSSAQIIHILRRTIASL
jgi:hypothetical protein